MYGFVHMYTQRVTWVSQKYLVFEQVICFEHMLGETQETISHSIIA